VIATASEFARQTDGEVLLLHVIQTIPGLSMDVERNFYDQLESASRTFLTKLSETFTDQGIRTSVQILKGNRGEELLSHATDNQVDVIIVRSPRINPSNPRSAIGSLSWKIGLLAPCDVLLIR
jgi:nucleotide-binding universal stress UspA family protein